MASNVQRTGCGWPERDRELLGISWVNETNQQDERFYWGYDSDNNLIPIQLTDEPEVDEDGNETGRTQTGLKTRCRRAERDCCRLLAPSDWRVVKELEVTAALQMHGLHILQLDDLSRCSAYSLQHAPR